MTRLGPENLDEPISQHVRTDYTTLLEQDSVGQALQSLRGRSVAEKIIYFYVVDADNQLKGVVPTRRLLMSRPEQPITEIMVADVVAVPAEATVLTTCEFFILHRFLALPVVDEQRRLIGVVDVNLFTEEVISMAEQRSAERAFQIIGVHVALGRRVPPWVSFKDRFPWLLCNIGGGIACALLSGLYESLLDAVVVLCLFIPVVLALAESVSIQSMTLTLQALHQERIQPRLFLRNLSSEFLTSLLLGAGSGTLVGLIAFLWKGRIAVALSIGLSITLSMIFASLLGVIVPTLVRAFRRDPRIAAGPIVLASADMGTILFYFNLAGWLLKE